jgi:hypothetical protein
MVAIVKQGGAAAGMGKVNIRKVRNFPHRKAAKPQSIRRDGLGAPLPSIKNGRPANPQGNAIKRRGV